MDVEGFVLAVEITAANLNDRQGLYLLLDEHKAKFPRLRKIWADMGYLGEDTRKCNIIGYGKRWEGGLTTKTI